MCWYGCQLYSSRGGDRAGASLCSVVLLCSVPLYVWFTSHEKEFLILSDITITQRLSAHPLWTRNEEGHLVRRFVAKNFKVSMDFLNLAAEVAESFGHHPDFHLTSYRNVEVRRKSREYVIFELLWRKSERYRLYIQMCCGCTSNDCVFVLLYAGCYGQVVLYTHSVKGITDLDFSVIEQLDALPVVYSPKWERENVLKRKQDEQKWGVWDTFFIPWSQILISTIDVTARKITYRNTSWW